MTCAVFLGGTPQLDFVSIEDRSEDSHSPTFYRILNIDVHLGNQQPNMCRNQRPNFKDCISPFIGDRRSLPNDKNPARERLNCI